MIISVFRQYKKPIEALNLVFCSDEYLLEINRAYLQHNYYTDIITFDLSAPGAPINGEIYISVDRVRENAQVAKVSFGHELHRVIFHGVLHLCGFGDKTVRGKEVMTGEEDRLLKKYFK